MSSYQIAFHFTQSTPGTPLAVTLSVTGDNTFLAGGTYTQQVFPYAGQYVPSLVNLSVTGTALQVTAAPGDDTQSLEFVTYVTAKGSGLAVNLDMRGDVQAGYTFLGAQGAGGLTTGANTIPFPTA